MCRACRWGGQTGREGHRRDGRRCCRGGAAMAVCARECSRGGIVPLLP